MKSRAAIVAAVLFLTTAALALIWSWSGTPRQVSIPLGASEVGKEDPGQRTLATREPSAARDLIPPPVAVDRPAHWLLPAEVDREKLTEWGRRMLDNPGADLGVLWCDYRLDVLLGRCDEEGMRTTPLDGMLQDSHLNVLEASREVNPRGLVLSEAARSDLRAMIGSYRVSIVEVNTALHVSLMQTAKRAIGSGQGCILAPRLSARPTPEELAAQKQFNDQIRPTADRIYTGVPGRGGADPDAQRGRMVVVARAEHPEVFGHLDRENSLLADLDVAIRQYFASIR